MSQKFRIEGKVVDRITATVSSVMVVESKIPTQIIILGEHSFVIPKYGIRMFKDRNGHTVAKVYETYMLVVAHNLPTDPLEIQ